MKNLLVFLCLVILGVLVWKLWKPSLRPPITSVPNGEATLYFFYTDWCGFSRKAMPEWEKAVGEINGKTFGTTKVTTKEVDAENDKKTAERYDVSAYPTLLLETADGIYTFQGKRSSDRFVAFVRESLGKEV